MIRINLIGDVKARKGEAAPSTGNPAIWAVAYAVALLGLIAVCAIMYFGVAGELEEQVRANRQIEEQNRTLAAESAGLEEAQAELAASRALEEVVAGLSRGRTGPARAMIELSNILSSGPGAGPTIDPAALEALRRDNPLATYNRAWDPKRLWIEKFEEEDRHASIEGVGRTNDDVAEFLRRLQLSELFDGVTLLRTQAEDDAETGGELIHFELECEVTY